jgi:hypothetical protein
MVPIDRRDERQVGEGGRAVLRLVPGLEGKARQADVGPGLLLEAAQGRHAGIGDPRPFPARRRTVDQQDVAHPVAPQGVGGDEAGLARTDDQHIERGLALEQSRLHPFGARMRRHLDLATDAGLEDRQVLATQEGGRCGEACGRPDGSKSCASLEAIVPRLHDSR